MSAGSRVAALRSRLRPDAPGDARGEDPALAARVHALAACVERLERTVDSLSAELLDARSQGRRTGEISDLVTELLAHEASRRDPEFARILERYLDD